MKNYQYLRRFFYAALLAVALLETGAHLAAMSDGKRAPLFQLDQKVGWVKIDQEQSALMGDEKSTSKTLILGDSFVFGEGVGFEERFDQQMRKSGYTDPIFNRGVSGYSTDQELISAAEDLDRLKAGDTVVLVTFGDDLRGLLSSFFASRPKPRYRFMDRALQLTPPSIQWIHRLRERSYLVRAFKKMTASKSATILNLGESKLDEAKEIYRELLLKYLVPVAERGVEVVIVFHGQKIVDNDFGSGFGQRVVSDIKQISQQHAFTFLDLGDEFEFKLYRQSNSVHWNAAGHQKFADLLTQACAKSSYPIHLSQKESR